MGLSDYLEGSVRLDSLITWELLVSLFWPHNPTHDGAAIIQGDRIVAAGCLLPLSRNPDLDPNLGTRHRAALGITENSDALALVVSETNGAISLARGGKLKQNLTRLQLRQELQESSWKPTNAKDRSLKGWLASLGRHKALKVLAFFLAVALWFAVGGEERTETTLNLPLEIINRNPDLMLVNEIPLALQVRVSGPRSTIRNLSQARQSHTIDLAGVKAGRHTISVGPSAFSFPRGVTVTRVQPNSLTLTLVATVTRTLAIQPVVIGSPPNGFALQSVKIRLWTGHTAGRCLKRFCVRTGS